MAYSVNTALSRHTAYRSVMEEALTWTIVAERLETMPRGAAYQLSKTLGMNSSYLYRKLKSGGDLSERHAQQVRAFFNETPPEPQQFGPPPTSSRNKVPVFGYAAASDGERIALNEGEVIDWIELPHGLALGPGEFFGVRPMGSSMEPRIFPGETLIVRKNYPPARDRDVVIEFTDGSGVIKTYEGQRQGHVFAKQWNEPKTLTYEATKVRALHAVAFKL
ncbi:S24 family peptidase [Caulobacter hibisci]|uniref:LexA family transcriptional regulator n=1 Tax=Caulobacter hibisci TaxID=2035993 RepID=A0ABS0SXT9_9CAUL|nr:LexA family transcriptional regulator [Caulobacter hibisci]MBI1684440.1 LexA family transcriptional regulator [Caulobacter hibisci]